MTANSTPSPNPKKRRRRWFALLAVAAVPFGIWLFAWWLSGNFPHGSRPLPKNARYVRRTDIDYLDGAAPASQRQRLDLYVPFGLGETAAPIVGLLHGGGWASGDRRQCGEVAAWLAERGVIAAAIDYRVRPFVAAADLPWDAARATVWLHRHAAQIHGDPQRIFLLGHSAGGQLAALIAADRKYLDALGAPPNVPAGVVPVSAPFDLRDISSTRRWATRLTIGFAFDSDLPFRWSMSPLAHVRPGLPPFLIIRGAEDPFVTQPEAEAMAAAIRAAGGSANTVTAPGRSHIAVFVLMPQPGDQAAAAVLRFVTAR